MNPSRDRVAMCNIPVTSETLYFVCKLLFFLFSEKAAAISVDTVNYFGYYYYYLHTPIYAHNKIISYI